MFRLGLALMPQIAITMLGALALSVTWFGAMVILFGALDAHGRYRDYAYLSSFKYLTQRLALFYGKSFCGRWMIGALNWKWHGFYKNHGYRFWHLLPDGAPSIFLQRRFWRTLFLGHRA